MGRNRRNAREPTGQFNITRYYQFPDCNESLSKDTKTALRVICEAKVYRLVSAQKECHHNANYAITDSINDNF